MSKVFGLLRAIINTDTPTVPTIAERNQKKAFPEGVKIIKPLERSTPYDEGISSEACKRYIEKLYADKSVNIQNLMIIKNSKVICECSFGGQRLNIWKNTYSECKSIVSLTIGMMCDEKILTLDDKIVTIFGKKIPAIAWVKLKDLTVRHLLTMTSTILFNEAESIITEDWQKAFFNSTTSGTMGKTFNYNSLNTYILSCIIKELTGQGISEYLRPRLFEPLGIKYYYWEKCHLGVEKGGWGLYILPEDMAKIGVMVMQGGIFNGKRIISKSWIEESTSLKIKTPVELCKFDYAYQIWVGRVKKAPCFLFNGMLGQNLIGFWRKKLIVVVNASNGDIFQDNNFFKYTYAFEEECELDSGKEDRKSDRVLQKSLEKYSGAPFFLYYNERKKYESVEKYIEKYFKPFIDLGEISPVSGAEAVGLFPSMLQVIQNSYSSGTYYVKFEIDDENKLYLCYYEYAVTYKVCFGLHEYVENRLILGKDQYIALAEGSFSTDEDGRRVLKIYISFPETPFERLIKFFINHDGTVMAEYCEAPADRLVVTGINVVNDFVKSKPLINSAINLMDNDYIDIKAERIFEPRIKFEKLVKK